MYINVHREDIIKLWKKKFTELARWIQFTMDEVSHVQARFRFTPFTNVHAKTLKFTRSYVENGGGGLAAMLDPPRDRPPYSLGCALYPWSCPLGLGNEERLDTLLSYCTPPVADDILMLSRWQIGSWL